MESVIPESGSSAAEAAHRTWAAVSLIAGVSMTTEQAIEFLRRHQPLPLDSRMSQELIDEWFAVLEYLRDHPKPAAVPLLLGAVSDVASYGYTVLAEVLDLHPREAVSAALLEAMGSADEGRRVCAMDLSRYLPGAERYRQQFLAGLRSNSRGERASAIDALGPVATKLDVPVLQEALAAEEDIFNREAISE